MSFIYDIPILLVVIAVVLNIILGLFLKISFIALMYRSIVVTIVFSIIGYLISETFAKAITLSKKRKSVGKSCIDYSVPPITQEEFNNYINDEFIEINPADLHKNKN